MTTDATSLRARPGLLGVVLAACLPGLCFAGTWTDDFEDDVLTPPWTDIEGTNSESIGQLHTSGMSGGTHVGPVVHTVVPQLVGSDHAYFSGTVTSNDGGAGFTLKANSATGDRCGIYIWSNGDVWATHDDSREHKVGEALLGPSANAPTLLEAELDGTTVTLFLYGTEVFSDTITQCDFTGDGTVGLELHTGRTAHWDDYNASWYEPDSDGDGYCPGNFCEGAGILPGDCDDADALNSPGGIEVCDGQDNDCDTLIDDADPNASSQPSWWTDSDVDGYGDPATEVIQCTQPAGTASNGDDCNDGDVAINPGQAEACNAIDDDCSGSPDPGEADDDGDGMMICAGDCDDDDALTYGGATELCDGLDNDCDGVLPANEDDSDSDAVMVCQGDCDDADATVHPGANEACDGLDNDCDGVLPGTEANGDGDALMICAGDCNDSEATVYPGAPELCDGLDNDCDGVLPGTEANGDGDTFMICDGDCNDSAATVYPGAPELCDGIDNDCDGALPANEDDSDLDAVMVCQGDCDDADATVHPGANEACDGLDNDCDGALPGTEANGDGDTFMICAGDCNDSESTVYPGAPELCDGLDNDCDGILPIDEADLDFLGGIDCDDGDGDGFSELDGDCNDTLGSVAPGLVEVCDTLDNNCNGQIDEGLDSDNDGIADCYDTEVCDGIDNNGDGTIDEGYDIDGDGVTICEFDCDDREPATFPGNAEICDLIDNDCDDIVDNAPDVDLDTFGPCDGDCDDDEPLTYPGADEDCNSEADHNCDGIPGNVDDFDGDGVAGCNGDCDDDDDTILPGAEELCDEIDNNCDGAIDEGFDADSDGHSVCGGDCDDETSTTYPGAEELCNGVDDDCDELVPDDESDADEDTFRICDLDCDDAEAAVFPGAEETCEDEIDLDCDGIAGSQAEGCGPGPDDQTLPDPDVTPQALPECGCSTVRSDQRAGVKGWLLALLAFGVPLALGRRRR